MLPGLPSMGPFVVKSMKMTDTVKINSTVMVMKVKITKEKTKSNWKPKSKVTKSAGNR